MFPDKFCVSSFPDTDIFAVSSCTARTFNRQVRAVRQEHELLELFTQNELAETGSAGDAEEYKRESETVSVTFAGALFALLAVTCCFGR